MIDLERALERALEVYPDKDPIIMEEAIRRMVEDLREDPPDRGDFRIYSTYGVAAFQAWYANEDEPDAIHVYAEIGSDYDHGELI